MQHVLALHAVEFQPSGAVKVDGEYSKFVAKQEGGRLVVVDHPTTTVVATGATQAELASELAAYLDRRTLYEPLPLFHDLAGTPDMFESEARS